MTAPPRIGPSFLNGRLLAASALWSLAAQVIPAIAGVAAIPFIVRGLGVERFGVLTLAWVVIGYFSLFDLGLGRAITKFAAELLPTAARADIDRLLWTAWYLMLALGGIGAVALAVAAPWLVRTAIKLPPDLEPETMQTFYLLALSIPIVVLTAGLRGLLEAAQQFRLTSLVKIPTGLLTFIIPLVVLRFTPNLAVVVLALIVVRVVGAVVYAVMCQRSVHRHHAPTPLDRRAARALLGFGAWMTVSNVVSPLMVSVDRFFVGAFLTVSAVAYYATPFEAVTKLLIIPGAITAVLFPAFSTASRIDPAKMVGLFRTGSRAIFVSVYPMAFVVITFAPELLRVWLGSVFAVQSADVLRWLALGVLTNSLATLPFALLQGVGRSDTTAKIHLLEAPVYLVLMIWLIRGYGINGAAIAWCARSMLDMALLYWSAARYLRPAAPGWLRDMTIVAALTPVMGAAFLVQTPLQKVFLTTILVILFAVLTWRWTVAGGRGTGILRLLTGR